MALSKPFLPMALTTPKTTLSPSTLFFHKQSNLKWNPIFTKSLTKITKIKPRNFTINNELNTKLITKNDLFEALDSNIIETVQRTLQKTAVAAVLVGLLLMYGWNTTALAASSGRMGGSSFSSKSRSGGKSRSYSYSSSSSSSSYSYSKEETATIYIILIIALIINCYSDIKENETSVVKVQVGLLGMARSLQNDLNRIAEAADTSTPEGLSFILTETILALLRHPDYCISAYSSVEVEPSMEIAEKEFNQHSIKEREKSDKETLTNVNGMTNQSEKSLKSSEFSNEYIVVTILVVVEGSYELPNIKNITDLKAGLQNLSTISSEKTKAVEVLWTPQLENDSLSHTELMEDYPLLQPL